MKTNIYDPQDFYDLMYAGSKGFIEIRELPAKRNNQHWVPYDKVTQKVSELPNGNIYHGCATRKNGIGTKDGIIEIPYLWADIDFETTRERWVLIKLNDCKCKPSIIIHSGNGLHVYWKFKSPFLIKHSKDISYIENYLKILASYFRADMASTDIARILRVPGTKNYKYDPPKDAYISFISGRDQNVK